MASLSEVSRTMYGMSWTRNNNFSIKIAHKDENFAKKFIKWDIGSTFAQKLNAALINITTPDFTNQPIEEWVGANWRYHNGRDELYRFTMTFRDYDQMHLYKEFLKWYQMQKMNYFDKIAAKITITLDAEYNVSETDFLIFDDCMIESLSNATFDHNTENQITEFSVTFKSAVIS
jgi:hypothetical protein